MKKRNILCCSFLIISFCLIFINISDGYKVVEKNEQAINTYFNVENNNNMEETYMGILEIPAIHLKRGFYSSSSSRNTVEENITVINRNCLPTEPCNFILASHSGSSNISYFKHLDTLELHDIAIIYYQNNKIIYHLERKTSVLKNGTLTLPKKNEKMLILTTCNKKDNNLQDIYYFQ